MNRFRTPIIAAVILLLAGLAVYFFMGRPHHRATPSGPNSARNNEPCPGKTREAEMKDPYMRGIIEKGAKYRVLPNWYACHPLVAGDYVEYRYNSNIEPVVRIVRAIPGDEFHLVPDKQHKAWNLEINGQMLMSGPEPYFFGAETPPPLSLYEKSRQGVVGADEAIVLSSWAPGDIDSSLFGLVNIVDLVGKVEEQKGN